MSSSADVPDGSAGAGPAAALSARCARTLVAGLVAGGVRHVVLAPGSRSAPLAYALLAAADAGLLHLHVRLDERSAGFVALGAARAGESPVAVVTTSGTAVANLHPAVLEAASTGVPLVLLTADRPGALTHTGANQTTEQHRLFGVHLRGAAHLEVGASTEGAWRFQLSRLLALACGTRSRMPGPVQLNVAFAEPLVPDGPIGMAEGAAPAAVAPSADPEPPPVHLPPGPRTVIVAGDLSPVGGRRVAALAEQAGVPLLAEPSSNARRGAAAVAGYRLLLGGPLADRVQRAVVVGHPTLSRPVQRLLGRSAVEVVVVTGRPDWYDPGWDVSQVVAAVALPAAGPDWLTAWHEADRRVRAGLTRLLGDATRDGEAVSGPALAATVWEALPAGAVLVAGASQPIRDLDLAAVRPDPPDVYANRGLAGIDGTVSTAWGAALALERPVHVLLGDLTFLHDAGGLLAGRLERRPDLRIIVADDGGGSIFAALEHGRPEFSATYERLFGTPQEVDLAALVEGYGAVWKRAADLVAVRSILSAPPRGVEVVAVAVDRSRRRDLEAAMRHLA